MTTTARGTRQRAAVFHDPGPLGPLLHRLAIAVRAAQAGDDATAGQFRAAAFFDAEPFRSAHAPAGLGLALTTLIGATDPAQADWTTPVPDIIRMALQAAAQAASCAGSGDFPGAAAALEDAEFCVFLLEEGPAFGAFGTVLAAIRGYVEAAA